jgi:large subunit ribosomal protein L22
VRTYARARFVRVSSRKAGLVLREIRGKSVGEALAILQFTPRAAARLVEKVLRSAVANAEHNHQVRDLDALRVVQATADGGPGMKRVQPRAMGRAFFIKHRTSHLTIGVTDETNGAVATPRRAAPPAPPGRRPQRGRAPESGTAVADTPKAKTPRRGRTPRPRAAAGKGGKKSKETT